MRRFMTAVLMLLIITGACSRKPQPTTPAPTEAPPSRPPAVEPAPSEDAADRRARETEEARRREEAMRNRATLEQMVFFDYDRANVREDAKPTLNAKLPVLRANPLIRIRIEGHADERGSVEYNLALSLRRAQSVRAYLVDFGISASRMEVVGLGEELPRAAGMSEAAFAQNRRTEFRILAGLDQGGR